MMGAAKSLPKRSLARLAAAGAVAWLWILPSTGSWPAQQVPTVDQILAHYVSALGGREALLKITTRHAKGTIQIPGQAAVGTAESFSKAPNKYFAKISFPGFGETSRGYDGAQGWVSDDQNGPRELAGQELASLARAADLYQALDLKKQYPKLTLKGADAVDGRAVYILEGDPGDGTLRRMYFDQASGLLVKNEENTTIKDEDDPAQPDKQVVIVTDIQDYRDVDGVKYPFLLIQHNGSSSITIRLSEVEQNVAVEDAVFAKPSR
jgi:zinc protease